MAAVVPYPALVVHTSHRCVHMGTTAAENFGFGDGHGWNGKCVSDIFVANSPSPPKFCDTASSTSDQTRTSHSVSVKQVKIDRRGTVGFDLYPLDKGHQIAGIRHVLPRTPIVVVVEKHIDQPFACGDFFDLIRNGFTGIRKVESIDFMNQERFFAVAGGKVFAREEKEVNGALIIALALVSRTSCGGRNPFFASGQRSG